METGVTVKPKTSGRIPKTVTAAAVILVLALLAGTSRRIDFQSLLTQGLEWVDTLGPAGPAAFVVMYILACVLMIPGRILTPDAGWSPNARGLDLEVAGVVRPYPAQAEAKPLSA